MQSAPAYVVLCRDADGTLYQPDGPCTLANAVAAIDEPDGVFLTLDRVYRLDAAGFTLANGAVAAAWLAANGDKIVRLDDRGIVPDFVTRHAATELRRALIEAAAGAADYAQMMRDEAAQYRAAVR